MAPNNNMGPSRSKQLISVDQNLVYRVHKVKGARLMSEKDFLLTEEDLGNEDPNKIPNLRSATLK